MGLQLSLVHAWHIPTLSDSSVLEQSSLQHSLMCASKGHPSLLKDFKGDIIMALYA